MTEKVLYRSMNFPLFTGMFSRFSGRDELEAYYRSGGLNGLEVIHCDEPIDPMVENDMINGVHLFFHLFWMDFWKEDYKELNRIFDSREQWIEYFGGETKDAYISRVRQDLAYAKSVGAKYVVFHVSESAPAECFSFRCKYSDEEVIDAAIEVINLLLDDSGYEFEFLMENLWWTGLNLKNPTLTKRLLDGIHYKKKGIMLDTGHYLNTNPDLKSGAEACMYLLKMYHDHEKAGLGSYFKGMHLQYSLSGEYVRGREWEKEKWFQNFDKLPFYEKYRLTYEHAQKVDWHRPFLDSGIREVMDTIAPIYVTYEFKQNSKEQYLEWAKLQTEKF